MSENHEGADGRNRSESTQGGKPLREGFVLVGDEDKLRARIINQGGKYDLIAEADESGEAPQPREGQTSIIFPETFFQGEEWYDNADTRSQYSDAFSEITRVNPEVSKRSDEDNRILIENLLLLPLGSQDKEKVEAYLDVLGFDKDEHTTADKHAIATEFAQIKAVFEPGPAEGDQSENHNLYVLLNDKLNSAGNDIDSKKRVYTLMLATDAATIVKTALELGIDVQGPEFFELINSKTAKEQGQEGDTQNITEEVRAHVKTNLGLDLHDPSTSAPEDSNEGKSQEQIDQEQKDKEEWKKQTSEDDEDIPRDEDSWGKITKDANEFASKVKKNPPASQEDKNAKFEEANTLLKRINEHAESYSSKSKFYLATAGKVLATTLIITYVLALFIFNYGTKIGSAK